MNCLFCKSAKESKIHGQADYVCGSCFAKLTQLDQDMREELYLNCFDVGYMDKVNALDMIYKPGGSHNARQKK